jgi:hypothetical protein
MDEAMPEKVIDFGTARDKRDAHQYRLLQAAAMIELFTLAHGRGPDTSDELGEWLKTRTDILRPIDPYAVLTDEQMSATLAKR